MQNAEWSKAPCRIADIQHSAFIIQHFLLRFLQQNDIHREVVAIAIHPDATGKGAEGIAVVFATMLFQEFLIVYFRVLELVIVVAVG